MHVLFLIVVRSQYKSSWSWRNVEKILPKISFQIDPVMNFKLKQTFSKWGAAISVGIEEVEFQVLLCKYRYMCLY